MDIIVKHDNGDINITCDIKSANYTKEDDSCKIFTDTTTYLENIAKITVVSGGKYKIVLDNYQEADRETWQEKYGTIGVR